MPVQKLIGPDIADVILNSCMETSAPTNSPSSTMPSALGSALMLEENLLLAILKPQLATVNQSVRDILQKFSTWNAFKGSKLSSANSTVISLLKINQAQHSQQANVNYRLYVISQLAVFANYIKSQETDQGYGEARTLLIKVRNELLQTICTLMQLLQSALSKDDLRMFVTQDCSKPEFTLASEPLVVKRFFTYIVLQLMADTLANIKMM